MHQRRRRREFSIPRLWQILGVATLGAVVAVLVVVSVMPQTPTATARGPFVPTEEPAPVIHQAVMIGDSYFNGWGGVGPQEALGVQTARALGYTPILRGAGATGYATARTTDGPGGEAGSFIDDLSTRPIDDLNSVELVVINGGLADRSLTEVEFDAGMRHLINLVREQQPTATIVILGPPNLTVMVERSRIDERQRAIAASEGLAYISFDEVMAADELHPLISADLTHPVPETVPTIVERIAARLVALGVVDYRP